MSPETAFEARMVLSIEAALERRNFGPGPPRRGGFFENWRRLGSVREVPHILLRVDDQVLIGARNRRDREHGRQARGGGRRT